ncbi:MAG TPA: PilZ domain-containing protein [Pyrinomonadaceae bacterium]|nr:PilZ domain-containing protein [Pyrinomonadaceae bacterium]
MEFEGKSKRLRERIKLALPVRVLGRETREREWMEMSRLIDVTPFGASFALAHPTEPGRLLHLTLPMPRQLRCFDHVEDQYRVWALVRRVRAPQQQLWQRGGELPRVVVGVAFTGKHPPASYLADPATRYDVDALSKENNLWTLREIKGEEAAGGRAARSEETRLQVAISVTVEVLDDEGRVTVSEQTVTENISRRGAAVWTTLSLERGRFVRLRSAESGLSVTAAVRAHRAGPDGIPRLHLEFIDRQWPLEGIE